jgi:hypothetical protein
MPAEAERRSAEVRFFENRDIRAMVGSLELNREADQSPSK